MAVVQISRIQLRRGRKNTGTGLPQLASGELAWAIDTQELYIGNGAVSEGAPAVGNTKILTENDSILDLAESYQYKESDSTIQTGPDASNPVRRTMQQRLDEGSVNGKSYGIEPAATEAEATSDHTATLQNAVFNLYLNSDERNAVTLELDPGYYRLTGTVYLPSNVKIKGAGKDTTKLIFVKGGINAGASLALAGTSVTTAGLYTNLTPTTLTGTGADLVVNVQKTGTGASYTTTNTTITIVNSGVGYQDGDQIKILGSSLGGADGTNDLTITITDGLTDFYDYPTFDTDVVFEFINDSSTLTSKNSTPTTYILQPKNIVLEGFTAEVQNNGVKVFAYNDVRDSRFTDVKAVGPWTHSDGFVDESKALDMVAKTSLVTCQRNVFERFDAQGFTYGVFSNTDIINNRFRDCVFTGLYRGVSFGEGTGLSSLGPRKNIVSDSVFDTISREGIIVEKGYGNRSKGNTFINVGNNTGGNANNVYGQIKFLSAGNSSEQDSFDRVTDLAHANFAEAYVPEITGHASMREAAPVTISLIYTTTLQTAFRLPLNNGTGFKVDYVYQSSNYPQMRKGTMHIAVDKQNNNVQFVDEYEYAGSSGDDTNIVFTAGLTTTSSVETITIQYTNSNTSDDNTFTYTVTALS